MRIRLLTFATASDAVGASSLDLEIEEPCTLATLEERLKADYPDLEALWPRLAIAINGSIADPTAQLRGGDEVALLPPVSGGSESAIAPPATPRAALTHSPIDLASCVSKVESAGRGAVVIFSGNVRCHDEGRTVEGITYSAYESMALERLDQIVGEIESTHDDLRLFIVHRLGEVDVGEASVIIAAASPHRPPAYEASRTALERLKAEVPIWKREHYVDGSSRWREEESLNEPQRPSA